MSRGRSRLRAREVQRDVGEAEAEHREGKKRERTPERLARPAGEAQHSEREVPAAGDQMQPRGCGASAHGVTRAPPSRAIAARSPPREGRAPPAAPGVGIRRQAEETRPGQHADRRDIRNVVARAHEPRERTVRARGEEAASKGELDSSPRAANSTFPSIRGEVRGHVGPVWVVAVPGERSWTATASSSRTRSTRRRRSRNPTGASEAQLRRFPGTSSTESRTAWSSGSPAPPRTTPRRAH